jgi:hypothetical protein
MGLESGNVDITFGSYASTSALNAGKIGYLNVVDADLNYKALIGQDADANEFVYLAKDQAARVTTLTTTGAATLASLGVTGAATVGTTLGVSGAATLDSLGVTNGATIGTTLGVSGAATLDSLGVTNGATIGTTLGVSGAATLDSLGVTNGATIGTTLGVTGASDFTGNVNIGADNATKGVLNLRAPGSGTDGGAFYIHNSPDHETDATYYRFASVSGNLLIGPNDSLSSLTYTASTDTWDYSGAVTVGTTLGVTGAATFSAGIAATGGIIEVGVSDSDNGLIDLYGDGAGSTNGGLIRMHNPADHDSTVNFYYLRAKTGNLEIGPSADPDSFTYDVTGSWRYTSTTDDIGIGGDYAPAARLEVRGSTADGSTDALVLSDSAGNEVFAVDTDGDLDTRGYIASGVDDTVSGNVIAYGHATGSDAGGIFTAYTAADYDDTITIYRLMVLEDDLLLGPDTDRDSLLYAGDTDIWSFTGTGLAVSGTLGVTGTSSLGVLGVTGAATFSAGITETSGSLNVGVDDTTRGIINLYGDATSSGGKLNLYIADGYDGTANSFSVSAVRDELIFASDIDVDLLVYDVGTDDWRSTASTTDWILGGDAAPAARLEVRGSTADGSTDCQVWSDSAGSGIGSIDTDGNLSISDTMYLKEIASTSSKAGYGGIFPKSSDNKLYYIDSSGVEHALSNGTSGSESTALFFAAKDAVLPSTSFMTWDNTYGRLVLLAPESVDRYVDFTGVLDHYGGGGLTVDIFWTSNGTSGNVIWQAAVERFQEGTLVVTSDSFASYNSVTDAAQGVANVANKATITFTDGADMDSLADGEMFRIRVQREGTNASDTTNTDTRLFGIRVVETGA